jgi:hypothetical protein
VFASSIGTALDERNVRREFYGLLKSHSLPRLRPYDLRHSCATILLAAGEYPKVVQEMLGHPGVRRTHSAPRIRPVGPGVARLQAATTAAVLPGRNRVRRKSIQSNRRNGTTFQLLGAVRSC